MFPAIEAALLIFSPYLQFRFFISAVDDKFVISRWPEERQASLFYLGKQSVSPERVKEKEGEKEKSSITARPLLRH